ncbi:hypothetical protein [Saccharibacillus qingshengii]|uniref:hypothetical protein n=1 Tax=Saccharibacillus qingshengii TaxID=1763540 RepID=UPI0015532B7C|nr:hypothetical protein [Saccharibacillus qingshengii]
MNDIPESPNTGSRRLLITFGADLDHSNMDYLVRTLLKPYVSETLQTDYTHPVLRKGAELVLNLETFDTSPGRPFERYFAEDYHLTQAQLDGFLYKFRQLKGTHVFGNPNVRGHAEAVRGELEFSFLITHTLGGEALYVHYAGQTEGDGDKIALRLIPLLPPEERHLLMPIDEIEPLRQQRLQAWIDRLLGLDLGLSPGSAPESAGL